MKINSQKINNSSTQIVYIITISLFNTNNAFISDSGSHPIHNQKMSIVCIKFLWLGDIPETHILEHAVRKHLFYHAREILCTEWREAYENLEIAFKHYIRVQCTPYTRKSLMKETRSCSFHLKIQGSYPSKIWHW